MMAARNPLRLQGLPSPGALGRRGGRLALALAAAGLVCTPAFSADGGRNRDAVEEARDIMQDLAACIVRHDHDVARRFVLTPLYETVDRNTNARVRDGECMGFHAGRLKMTPNLYRSALAEALIRTDLASWPVIDPSNVPAIKWGNVVPPPAVSPKTGKPHTAAQMAEFQQRYAKLSGEVLVGRLGECVVRADPAKSLALLKTEINKPDEIAALKALVPVFAGCVKQGDTVSLDRANMRSGIALSYYRLASTMMTTAQAGGTR